MSPQKKVDETLDLDSISSIGVGNLPLKYDFRVVNREKRLTLYHYIVHIQRY